MGSSDRKELVLMIIIGDYLFGSIHSFLNQLLLSLLTGITSLLFEVCCLPSAIE